jgi:hypothetical protein
MLQSNVDSSVLGWGSVAGAFKQLNVPFAYRNKQQRFRNTNKYI